MGIPALAAARQVHPDDFMEHGQQDWRASEHFLRLFALKLLANPMPFDVDMLKIDVPDGATMDTPWRLSRLSRQRYFELALEAPSPESPMGDGRIAVRIDHATLEPDSDIHALAVDHVVAVTPLSLDATSRTDFGMLRRILGQG